MCIVISSILLKESLTLKHERLVYHLKNVVGTSKDSKDYIHLT